MEVSLGILRLRLEQEQAHLAWLIGQRAVRTGFVKEDGQLTATKKKIANLKELIAKHSKYVP